MYEVGTKVVYPTQGVGIIEQVDEREFRNQKMQYYIMNLSLTEIKVYLPVGIAADRGLREVASEDEIQRTLKVLQEEPPKMDDDWKVRHAHNQEKLKRGTIDDLAEVVRNLYRRDKEKDLSTSEKKLFEQAFQFIVDEIALARGTSKVEVEHLITEILSASVSE